MCFPLFKLKAFFRSDPVIYPVKQQYCRRTIQTHKSYCGASIASTLLGSVECNGTCKVWVFGGGEQTHWVSHPWGATHATRGRPAPGEFTSSFCLLSFSSCGLTGETFPLVKPLTADHRSTERHSARGQTPGKEEWVCAQRHECAPKCAYIHKHKDVENNPVHSKMPALWWCSWHSLTMAHAETITKQAIFLGAGCVFMRLSVCVTAPYLSIAALKGSLAPVVPVLFQGNCRGSDCVTKQPFRICQLIREGRKNRACKPPQEDTDVFSASRMPSYTCRW